MTAKLTHTLSSQEWRKRLLDFGQEKATVNFTTPLTAYGDAEKLKELTFRFPLADFYVTNTKTGLNYKITYDGSPPELVCTGINWYRDGLRGQCAYLPRPFRVEMTVGNYVRKDITYFFD
jgi:hypothetical protein